jgi:hypothetical protein
MCSSSSSSLVMMRRACALRFAELSLGAEFTCLLHRKTECLTESLTDVSQLAGSGRSRIMDCCNRLGRATWASSARLYKLLPGYRRTHLKPILGFATSRCLRRLRSLLHPERRRAPANGRAGLWNHSLLRSCTGEGELGFWKALCATA